MTFALIDGLIKHYARIVIARPSCAEDQLRTLLSTCWARYTHFRRVVGMDEISGH